MKKKIFAFAMMIVLAFSLAGCGVNADVAAELVQAELDSQLKGEHAKLAELTNNSVENVKAEYDSEMDEVLDAFEGMFAMYDIDDTLMNDFVSAMRDSIFAVYSYAQYEVLESEKDGDNFAVTVQYTKLNNFAELQQIMTDKINNVDNYAVAEMSEEEALQLEIEMYKEAFEEMAAAPSYGDEATAVVKVVKGSDNVYICDLTDLTNLCSDMIEGM